MKCIMEEASMMQQESTNETFPSTSIQESVGDTPQHFTEHAESSEDEVMSLSSELDVITSDMNESMEVDNNSYENENHVNQPKNFQEELRLWAVKHNISLLAVSDLLKLYAKHHPDSNLPKDARTLLKTKRKIICEDFGNNDSFAYLGLEKGITQLLQHTKSSSRTLNLIINIDGTPLHNSTKKEVWPILCMVKDLSISPFPVGIYSGKSKPPLDRYLKNFLEELDSLMHHGIVDNGVSYQVKLHCFVCDAIARQYLKRIKSHISKSACEKCTVEGVHSRTHRTMSFNDLHAPLRTDGSFILQTDVNHHSEVGISPLIRIGVGLVSQFPLDYLHLVLLGVMKRLLKMWFEDIPYKLSHASKQLFNDEYESLKTAVPCEFSRKPRSIYEYKNFKGTEFRLILLYLGPVFLRRVLPDAYFKHFLLLVCGIRILSSKDYIDFFSIEYANKILRKFVETFSVAYPNAHTVYNVHSLIHLADDVAKYGALDNFSSFPFENILCTIKNLVRGGNNPLVQICKRLGERVDSGLPIHTASSVKCVIKPHMLRESCVCLKNGEYGIVTGVNETSISVKLFSGSNDLFDKPIRSRDIGFLSFKKLSDTETKFLFNEIKYKCMHVNQGNRHVVIKYLSENF